MRRTNSKLGILKLLSTSPSHDVVTLLSMIASSVEITMDGTSGALYAIFLNALTQDFKLRSGQATVADIKLWSLALTNASAALVKYIPAEVGDRTVIDVLEPFVMTLKITDSLKDAASAAAAGAAKTKDWQHLDTVVANGCTTILQNAIPNRCALQTVIPSLGLAHGCSEGTSFP
jgi:hypothetical protein